MLRLLSRLARHLLLPARRRRPRAPRPRRLVTFTLALLLAAPVATTLTLELPDAPRVEARSGGSGGGFRRSSGGSRSFGGGSRSRSSGGSFGGGGSSYRGGGGGFGIYFLTPQMIGIILVIAFAWFVINAAKSAAERRRAAAEAALAVARLQLGFDALSTTGLRDRIEQLVRDADTATEAGLWRLAQRVLDEVAKHLDSVSYASLSEETKLPPEHGEKRFFALTNEARALFEREIVRRDQGGLKLTQRNSDKANELVDEDGTFGIAEYFIVTLVMAARGGPIGLPPQLVGHDEVAAAVGAMRQIRLDRHIGFEVVWTPAAESDILSRDAHRLPPARPPLSDEGPGPMPLTALTPPLLAADIALDGDELARTAAFFFGALALIALAKWTRDLVGRLRGHRWSTLVIERDNVAAGVELAGFLLAMVLGLLGGLVVQGDAWWEQALDLVVTGALALAFLLFNDQLVSRLVLRGIDCDAAVAEHSNLAVAIVRAAGNIGTALVVAGALGNDSALGERVLWMLIGQVALVALSLGYQALTRYDDVAEVRHKNIAAAFPMAGVLIAVGVVVQAAVAGDSAGWGADLLALALDLTLSAVLIVALRWGGARLLLPGASFHDEIARDKNAGVGLIEGAAYLAAGLTVAYFLN